VVGGEQDGSCDRPVHRRAREHGSKAAGDRSQPQVAAVPGVVGGQ
jgi:hypothetical protein